MTNQIKNSLGLIDLIEKIPFDTEDIKERYETARREFLNEYEEGFIIRHKNPLIAKEIWENSYPGGALDWEGQTSKVNYTYIVPKLNTMIIALNKLIEKANTLENSYRCGKCDQIKMKIPKEKQFLDHSRNCKANQ